VVETRSRTTDLN